MEQGLRWVNFECRFPPLVGHYCMPIHNQIQESAFDATWKQVTNQSERQFGAFLFLYLLEQKTEFDQKKYKIEELKKFRNKVIHKGYLPNEQETIK
ncbi:MAG: hypothetical protein BM485_05040, partial [Desulfobulbaceae bacterium DB1]